MPAPEWCAVLRAEGFALGLRTHRDCLTEIMFLPEQAAQAARSACAAEALHQLTAYLSDPTFCFDLPTAASGSAHQHRVWAAIGRIPAGHTRFYGDLARELGSSARAVGQACGANPLPLVVPCHRVIAVGALGGFAHARDGFLPGIKQWLLRHEFALSTPT